MYSPETPVSQLPKVGPKLLKSLANLHIYTVEDLLRYYPTRYLDFSKFTDIQALRPGEVVTVRGFIKTISSRFSFPSRKMLSEAIISDSTGSLKVTWFNIGYIAESLKKGDEVLLSGKVDLYQNRLQLTNPIYEKVAEDHIHTGRLVPIYRLPEGLFPKTFRTLVHTALPAAKELPELIPGEILKNYRLPAIAATIQHLHFPETHDDVTEAQTRLAFEESLVQQLAVEKHKIQLKALAAPSIKTNIAYIKSLITKLPFTLTNGQKKALWECLQDLEHKHPMNRLLQGDVGSGKTIVAVLAALQVIEQGLQVVLLAPTEVLAKQHFDGMVRQHALFTLPASAIALYTRNFHMTGGESRTKKECDALLSEGKISLVIGTHALLQEHIAFKNAAFIIIDEQHRFGVLQRRSLLSLKDHEMPKPRDLELHKDDASAKKIARKKLTKKKAWVPHLLSMSATPIPRTAALAVYGDLAVSTIPELPKDRLPIKTWVVPEAKRAGAYEFIRKEVASGRQAFIITPLVEESDKLQIKSAKAEFLRLQKEVFPRLKLGLVHGSLKGADKDGAMLAFKNKETDILVATSVIEIGIDIPNATVILIEGADRFGLAQLHQLRGRVGRGANQSYCFLFSDTEASFERLDFFARTRDGFALAEYDMHTRGFGSLFGTSQTGFTFKYGRYLSLQVLENARKSAQTLIAHDPELLRYPMLSSLATSLSENLHLE